MKSIIKWILIALLLIGIIAGASVLYNKFSSEYRGEMLSAVTETTAETENTKTTDNTAENEFAAPDFTVLDYEDNEIKLSDYKGKPVVLNFWATWCYYCKEEMPDFNEAYKQYPDIQFMMVNATDGVQETMEMAKKYVEEEGFEFDVFFDTKLEAVTNYYVTGFPTTYFIGADGNLVTYASGMIDFTTLEKGISMITEQES